MTTTDAERLINEALTEDGPSTPDAVADEVADVGAGEGYSLGPVADDDGSVATLPALDYMRGFLASAPRPMMPTDGTAREWLEGLIDEVGHLRAELAERPVSPNERKGLGELSPTEIRVYRYLRNTSMRSHEIGSAMFISVNTVKTHTSHIYRKLDVQCRADLRRQPSI